MDRINKILNHDLFKRYYREIAACEKDRIFCKHDMTHFLDVARLAMLFNEQQRLGIEKELVYAAALLHDIGRYLQYQNGMPHEQASAALAPEILRDCGFEDKETSVIIKAISEHRSSAVDGEDSLSGIIYRADKLSRKCFACDAEPECDWKNDKKNMYLIW